MTLSKEGLILVMVFILGLIFIVIYLVVQSNILSGGLQTANPLPCENWLGNLKWQIIKAFGGTPSC
ncbi:MAG: hypothetical protein QXF15_01615 [Candidatus Aenigmatarchaeota archaeon]|nr:hypothetical protein [Candidatus Aenigmarchaeota archaeon]